jgi:hypothetical protein
MKLLSVSPFRAVIRVQDNNESDDNDSLEDEGNLQRETLTQQQNHQLDHFNKQSIQSPIKGDSQAMRGPREEYLTSFNEKRAQSGSGRQNQFSGSKSQERIKKESEYLRSQRETFLSGFAVPQVVRQ